MEHGRLRIAGLPVYRKYAGSEFRMYRVLENVRSTHSADGAVVLDIRQGQLFSLNVVGSRMLELMKDRLSEAAIVNQIAREFSVTAEIVEDDFQHFIRELKQLQLLDEPVSPTY